MKLRSIFLFCLAPVTAFGQDRDLDNKNRFFFGPRFTFNISANLQNLPVAVNQGPDYDDGFVREDSSRNEGGLTWNWGYFNINQITGPDTAKVMELHGTRSLRDGTMDKLDQSLQYGFELGYGRELFRFGDKKAPKVLGIEITFGGSALDLDMDNTLSGPVSRVNDRYNLGGIILPRTVPYQGSFEGPLPPNPPSPLIPATPGSSTITTEFATARQKAEINGSFWGFRVGPFFEAPIKHGWELQFGAGLALIRADAELSYAEAFTVTGLGNPPAARNDTQEAHEWLTGFYGEARVQYWFHDVIAGYVGVQYQHLDDLTILAANKEATIEFGNSIAVIFGVLYSF